MEVHFTPEQEAQLSEIVSQAGTDVERLVKDAALRLLDRDSLFVQRFRKESRRLTTANSSTKMKWMLASTACCVPEVAYFST